MIAFHYIAIDEQGQTVRGTIDAPDWNAARASLSARGLRDARPAAGAPDAPREPPQRLSNAQAIDLASYLAALARAELPIAPGVRAVASDLPSGKLTSVLGALASQLESGHSLESALETLGAGLPDHVRALMLVGARNDRLADTLDELLVHERSIDDLGHRLWQVVAYPVVLLVLLVLWLLLVSLWLIPQMELSSLLEDTDEVGGLGLFGWAPTDSPHRPSYRSRMMEFAHLMPSIILTLFCAGLVAVGGARLMGGKALVSRLWAAVPLVGPALWYRSLVEFAGLLSIFLKQQLPLSESLRLTSSAARNAAIRAAAAQAATQTAAGRELSQAIGGQSLFPPTLVNLVEWAERHDALADALDGAGQMYRDRFELQLRLVRLVLPPIVFLLVMGSAVFIAYGWIDSLISLITDLS